MNKGKFALLLFLYLLSVSTGAEVTSNGFLDYSSAQIRSSFHSEQFQLAIQQIEALDSVTVHHQYLKALAYFYQKKYKSSLQACDQLLDNYPDSTWQHKTAFLKAKAYIRLGDFDAAEQVYRSELERLLSKQRKNQIAQVYVDFAKKSIEVSEGISSDQPEKEDYLQAYTFYKQALEVEIDGELKSEVLFQMGRMMQLASDYIAAERNYQKLLTTFPANPSLPVNERFFKATVNLAVCQIHQGKRLIARKNLTNLLRYSFDESENDKSELIQTAKFLIVRTYYLPKTKNDPSAKDQQEVALGIDIAKQFIDQYQKQLRSGQLAFEIGQAYHSIGQTENAISAYQSFLDDFNLLGTNGSVVVLPINKMSVNLDDLCMQARFQLGQLYFDQRNFSSAIDNWNRYLVDYPNGPMWTQVQRRIIDAEFQNGIHLISLISRSQTETEAKTIEIKSYQKGLEFLDQFQKRYPLDDRVAKILVLKGQIFLNQQEFQSAISIWEQLINKYPKTEASSYALFQTGQIYENELKQLSKAMETYSRVTWGSWKTKAEQKLQQMKEKQLILSTEKVFRSGDLVTVRLKTRNIERVQVSVYKLNPEVYWRKMGTLKGIEELDLALIQPDKSWFYQIDSYRKYALIDQKVRIPMGQAGISAVHVSDGELESTTLVVRSDLELIAKTTRKETLVFVQNQIRQQPVVGAKVLVQYQSNNPSRRSASSQVVGNISIEQGLTGKDGVYRLDTNSDISVNLSSILIIQEDHIATNQLQIGDLNWPRELTAKGYIYTDRPVYQPGQTVSIRGIIREVDGKYVINPNAEYDVLVIDSQGREIYNQPVVLTPFGTFSSSISLDPTVVVGQYRITVTKKEEGDQLNFGNSSSTFNGQFLVQHYQLPNIRLEFDFERNIYFRGETIEAMINAKYTYGQPVPRAKITYSLPNGKTATSIADENGQIKILFDTHSLTEKKSHYYIDNLKPHALVFSANIASENSSNTATVLLAPVGFILTARPLAQVVLAGETVEIEVTCQALDGEPTNQSITLDLFRLTKPVKDDLFKELSWLDLQPPIQPAEIRILTMNQTTSSQTGKSIFRFKIKKGGNYRLRATGRDQFNQPVVAVGKFSISDQDDSVRLRVFTNSTQTKLGEPKTVTLHSRLKVNNKKLVPALLTFESDKIINYQIIQLQSGANSITFHSTSDYFPNFFLTVSAIEGSQLRTTKKEFSVQKNLHIRIKPKNEHKKNIDDQENDFGVYQPSQSSKFEILTTDQLGQPVSAELSLSLTESLLWEIFPNPLLEINRFFYADRRRTYSIRTVSSCGFSYQPRTQKIALAIRQEADRLKVEEKLAQERDKGQKELRKLLFSDANDEEIANSKFSTLESQIAKTASAPRMAARNRKVQANNSGTGALKVDSLLRAQNLVIPNVGEHFLNQVVWIPSIQTDRNGRATFSINLPNKSTQWDMRAVGCTKDVLVGESKLSLKTQKDFFLQVKLPSLLVEGDQIRPEVSVHNLTNFSGMASLQLLIDQGEIKGREETDLQSFSQLVDLEANSVNEFTLPAIEVNIPSDIADETLEIRITVNCEKWSDEIRTQIPIRPWGIPHVVSQSGWTKENRTLFLKLPADKTYTNPKLTIQLGKQVNRLIYDLAVTNQPFFLRSRQLQVIQPSRRSDLLSVASALAYLQQVGGSPTDNVQLSQSLWKLLSRLISNQREDGGWHWVFLPDRQESSSSDPRLSARYLWALIQARRAGISFNNQVIEQAVDYLRNALQRTLSSSTRKSDEQAAILLHALTIPKTTQSQVISQTDFSIANRLYRNRNRLSDRAKSYTALALVNMKRLDMADQILSLLPSLQNRVDLETLAISSLAKQGINKTDQKQEIEAQIRLLLSHQGSPGFWLNQDIIVTVLANYFGRNQFADEDYNLRVLVNGEVLTDDLEQETSLFEIEVPSEKWIKSSVHQELSCQVEFQLQGYGSYAYLVTLSGFSDQFLNQSAKSTKDVSSIKKNYYYPELTYHGKPIGVKSTANLKNLHLGQHMEVRIQIPVDLMTSLGSDADGFIIDDFLPTGAVMVDNSLKGDFIHAEVLAGYVRFYFPPKQKSQKRAGMFSIHYQLAGYLPGSYKILPTIIHPLGYQDLRPNRTFTNQTIIAGDKLVILDSDTSLVSIDSTDSVARELELLNRREKFVLGKHYFNDSKYSLAFPLLSQLRNQYPHYNTSEIARMLMWIYTDTTYSEQQNLATNDLTNSQQLVEVFEALRESQPSLFVPLERIQIIANAYRQIEEFERSMLVHQATINASFKRDIKVSGDIADRQQFEDSIRFASDLWLAYPDTPVTTNTYFGITQMLVNQASSSPTESVSLRLQALNRLEAFRTLYPMDPLADDAALSQINLLLDLEDYDNATLVAQQSTEIFADSQFLSSFQYMKSLAAFYQNNFQQAIESATLIADSNSENKNLAQYILGQIFHARNQPEKAIQWYQKIESVYSDAQESIEYFQQQKLSIPEVTIKQPQTPKILDLTYRNIDKVQIEIYQVDLMKLFLRQNSLSQMNQIRLAGVEPQLKIEVQLDHSKPYIDHKKQFELDLPHIGAYLIICRGDQTNSSSSQFTSGLLLVTPLEIAVQTIDDRLRVYLKDTVTGQYQPRVHLKAIGSESRKFVSGQTDMRGVFLIDGLIGQPTVIAKLNVDNSKAVAYAFYRGKERIGSVQKRESNKKQVGKSQTTNYRMNLNRSQESIQQSNIQKFEKLRRSKEQGIQMQYAY